MLGGLFGKKPQISIEIDGNPTLNAYRDHVTRRELPAYVPGDKVTGRLELIPPPGRVISHQGIVLTLFGEYREKDGTKLMRLFERQQFLAPAGDLSIAIKTEFSFDKIVFPTASYYGSAFDIVYGVELRVVQRLKDTAQSSEFIVFMFDDASENVPIHNEIGMTNKVHAIVRLYAIHGNLPGGLSPCHSVFTLSSEHKELAYDIVENDDNDIDGDLHDKVVPAQQINRYEHHGSIKDTCADTSSEEGCRLLQH